MLSAFFSLSVFVPLDLLKCRAQVTTEGQLKYSQEIANIIRNQGFMGMYRGFWACFWRELPGWGVYFASYEYIKSIMPDNLQGR